MSLRFPATLLLLTLLLVGCGSRQVILDPAGNPMPTEPATPVPAETGDASATADLSDLFDDPDLAMPTRATGDAGEPMEQDATDRNTMPLELSLNRTCARPGDVMAATATTLPDSKLAFAASYADNSFVPDFTYVPAEANPTGTFTWTWQITPTHPRGDALVTVVSAKREGDEARGASAEEPFRIALAC